MTSLPSDAALLAGFAALSTALVSDNIERMPGAWGLQPFHQIAQVMVGRALTVRTRSGDNLFIHKALDLIQPGDVLVVDGGGDGSRALVGEIMTAIARTRGAAGLVIDGAIRDSAVIGQSTFPCFARSSIHRGPYKNGPGEIGVPVAIGGMVIHPGDIVMGDADGVLAFPHAGAGDLLRAAEEQARREDGILRSIAAGTYAGAYAQPDR